MKYLSFSINYTTYAIPVEYISESIQYSHITRIPKMPDFVLGVMNLRGKIVPVMDTRIRMGLTSRNDERKKLIEILKKREREHVVWVDTLENEVMAGNNISVQQDPMKCDFGKWYTEFMDDLEDRHNRHGNMDNAMLNVLKTFKEPHKELHELAHKAEELIEKGMKDEAIKLIKRGRDHELKKMEELFGKLYDVIEDQAQRDIVIIIKENDYLFGITVDAIYSTIDLESLRKAPVQTELVQKVSVHDDQTIQILNLDAFTEIAKKAA